jgi:hypothetical protein
MGNSKKRPARRGDIVSQKGLRIGLRLRVMVRVRVRVIGVRVRVRG